MNTSRRMNQLLRNDRLSVRGEPEEPVEEPLGLPSEWGKPSWHGNADAGAGTAGPRRESAPSMNDVLRGWLIERVRR